MNYRHAFHAGNVGDVLKHVVLLAHLDALLRKDGMLRGGLRRILGDVRGGAMGRV